MKHMETSAATVNFMDHVTCNSRPVVALDSFTFLELVVHDVHGVTKGRLVTKNHLSKVLSSGEGLVSDLCYVGVQGEKVICEDDDYFTSGNVLLKPIPDTVVVSPRSANGQHRVGQVLCYLESHTGDLEFVEQRESILSAQRDVVTSISIYDSQLLDTSEPRTCAKLQLDKLGEMGLTLKSAFEIEFVLRKFSPSKEDGFIKHSCNMVVSNRVQEMMIDLMTEMKASAIELNTFLVEMDRDQYEFTLAISSGLEAPDMTARFKNWSKIFFRKRGYNIMYMTCVEAEDAASCSHLNHSLWNDLGENVLKDASAKGQLSEVGRHWLAGLVAHAPALKALCNPTVNCYRRCCDKFQAIDSSWGLDDRTTAFRVKTESSGNTYLENRLPASASNPYLVVAATVAAGMDGINRKLVLPPVKERKPLPSSLEAALEALQKDQVIVRALGPVVERFVYVKRRFELSKFKGLENVNDEVMFNKELEVYSHI